MIRIILSLLRHCKAAAGYVKDIFISLRKPQRAISKAGTINNKARHPAHDAGPRRATFRTFKGYAGFRQVYSDNINNRSFYESIQRPAVINRGNRALGILCATAQPRRAMIRIILSLFRHCKVAASYVKDILTSLRKPQRAISKAGTIKNKARHPAPMSGHGGPRLE